MSVLVLVWSQHYFTEPSQASSRADNSLLSLGQFSDDIVREAKVGLDQLRRGDRQPLSATGQPLVVRGLGRELLTWFRLISWKTSALICISDFARLNWSNPYHL